jgi:hypothetical protein
VVVVESGPRGLDQVFRTVSRRAPKVSDDSVAYVFTATGSTDGGDAFDASSLGDAGSLIESVVPGGFFVDQDELARRRVSEDEVLRAVVRARDDSGGPAFADAFPAIAVAFERYC